MGSKLDDMMGYPELTNAQLSAAVSLGKSIRSRYNIEGLDDVARSKVLSKADKEFSRKVKGGAVIFVNGQINFLHYNHMLRVG